MSYGRRTFLKVGMNVITSSLLPIYPLFSSNNREGTIRVVVWDERQPAQKKVYENFLGNQIAAHLHSQSDLLVRSVGLDDPEQGLSEEILGECDVLIWWGHQRQKEVTQETGRKIVERIMDGAISLIALHSAHWSTPFVEVMNELTRRNAEHVYGSKAEISYVSPPEQYTTPEYNTRITPYEKPRKFPDGTEKVEVHLPYCCFPAYRPDGKPSTVQILKPNHDIVKGIPERFEISQTEMYDEHFHVPEPDEVILEERWPNGEWFRSGMLWRLGNGQVFYFRPGHEIYPVYKEQWPLQVVTNAVRWLGKQMI